VKSTPLALAFIVVVLISVTAFASDFSVLTPESIGLVTQLALSDERKWPSRTLTTMRELSSKTDSLLEKQLTTDISYLEEYCGEVRDGQELLLQRLRVPGSSPKRTKDILIAWTRLIRSLDLVYTRAAVITARLRVHFRAPADAKPYDDLKAFYAEAARLAIDQQRTMKNFILALPE
jgi:hypothetical protein